MGPKTIEQTKNKWSNDQINTLIDAYKIESCLYAVNSANYHNKHLRNEALKRVGDIVRVLRPHATDKDCATKFHTLRTQYNIENAKVKASIKSGTWTDNIYKPSLWYYDHLTFLDAYFNPRKSRNSMEVNASTKETVTQSQYSQDSIDIVTEGFMEDGSLQVFAEESGDTVWDVRPPPPISPGAHTPMPYSSTAAASVKVLPSTSVLPGPSTICPCPSASAVTSASSTISSYQPRAAKRKTTNEDVYVGAIASLAESLRQPVVISNTKSDNITVPVEENGITGFLTFLGSVIRSIQSEELRLDLMNTMMQTTINARTLDLDRSRNKS